jgi:predicted TPR repeat methyltransferase
VKYDEKLGADVWLKLGNIHLKRHHRAEAVTCWERALALDPESQVIRHNLEAVRAQS